MLLMHEDFLKPKDLGKGGHLICHQDQDVYKSEEGSAGNYNKTTGRH